MSKEYFWSLWRLYLYSKCSISLLHLLFFSECVQYLSRCGAGGECVFCQFLQHGVGRFHFRRVCGSPVGLQVFSDVFTGIWQLVLIQDDIEQLLWERPTVTSQQGWVYSEMKPSAHKAGRLIYVNDCVGSFATSIKITDEFVIKPSS